MQTAMQAAMDERDASILDATIAQFARDYRPEDPRHAFDFDMALNRLVRMCYAEAFKPFQKTFSDALSMRTQVATFMPLKHDSTTPIQIMPDGTIRKIDGRE
jgi:hypothetical protein